MRVLPVRATSAGTLETLPADANRLSGGFGLGKGFERRQPFREAFLREVVHPALVFLRRAIERRPPFDEGLRVPVADRRDTNGRRVVAYGEGRGPVEFVGI